MQQAFPSPVLSLVHSWELIPDAQCYQLDLDSQFIPEEIK